MFIRLAPLVALAAGLFAALSPAQAQIGSERYAAMVVDHRNGTILVSANADETRHPASLTKMMTLYMVFDALRDGRLSLGSAVPISEEAASRPPSKLGIPAGGSVTVEQGILSLVTKSANDVAAAFGELLGGSEERFAQMMTQRARELGMTRTTFRNASGLPDWDQVTTARDMVTLGRRLMLDFPDRYHYFGRTEAAFRGLRLRSHNRMLTSYEGVDGIKTGYIRASGFNIVTSANRDGRRVVGAVFGGSSWVERDQHMTALLDQGFDRLGATPRAAMAQAAAAPLVMRQAQAATSRSPRAAARTATAPTRTATRQAPRPAARSASAARATPARPAARSARAARTAPRPAAARTAPRPAAACAAATSPRPAAQPARRAAAPTPTVRTATRGTAATSRSAARSPVTTRSAIAPRRTTPLAPPRPRR
ncbi:MULTISPECIES: D-alanyl-D-alanine carboxypeptidase family protein [Roseomonadaceae]|uniref:D-alanyl-D-alanine carboxypeptidase n=1 Tax=Falsiroseomonas oleicola TaxID=2801474 RepID=A0ABS6H325_9PROT|nr:D-alanyl-D-alanine carboxypeptidase family protein [Roseomonas oleicola]MBU8543067.1 D-alanyl-D-alanine carboxypeptidase [Roseomonas oleicola]